MKIRTETIPSSQVHAAMKLAESLIMQREQFAVTTRNQAGELGGWQFAWPHDHVPRETTRSIA